ncbi:hypothetical protein IE53DRAFT_390898 [Violaceomyces palustris]|uniref:Uncharacterized protein n=1 Tax=Violaceomyces palustris TaxID=1673888 RepID=A0ACD0NMD1_9BASI|nr:hypothetical protein IE53DRAFT_390898 [Violaceomyces palustris]
MDERKNQQQAAKEAKRLREQERRATCRAIKDNPLVIQVCKATGEARLTGEWATPPGFTKSIRPNLTLLEGERPILQRISPTSLQQRTAAAKSAAQGLNLFQELQEAAGQGANKTRRGAFILGYSHTVGHNDLKFTGDTLNCKTKDQAAAFLFWAKKHTTDFLETARPLIHDHFQAQLRERTATSTRGWLRSQLGERNGALLHPWWTTLSLFDTYTGQHADILDAEPSFLFNFGHPCELTLHEYAVTVTVAPFEILIMNTGARHSTSAAPTNTTTTPRWAFSAFFRQAILSQVSPSPISSKRLESAKAKVNDGRKRVRYTYVTKD